MQYDDIRFARFKDRPNRFTAHVELNGTEETVHVKNTGRCRELLLPDSRVALEKSSNPERKTRYDLISVYKDNLGWVNIDSMAPNAVVKEWLEQGDTPFGEITLLKPEFRYGASRVDFYLECEGRRCLIEVKGCTLERNGTGYFPDAPTERGVKHLHELACAAKQGLDCYIAFVIAMPGVETVHPNLETHPQFGTALEEACTAGVKILYLGCEVQPDSIAVSHWKTGVYPEQQP